MDEITTAQSARLASAGDVIAQSQVYVNQAPLFYLITWLLRPWGDGELILRLPAAIAGILTVFAVYIVGKQLLGMRAGLAASLVMAVSPYAVWYSQEARNYSLLMLLTTMQVYFAFTAITRSRPADWLGLAVFTTLNLYTHYLALASTAAIAIYVAVFLGIDLLRGARNRVKGAVAVGVIAAGGAAALAPWHSILRSIYMNAADVLQRSKTHRLATVAATLVVIGVVVLLGLALRRSPIWAKLAATTAAVTPIRKLLLAVAAGAIVVLAYAPWLPYLHLALSRPDVTFQRLQIGHQPSVTDALSLLSSLGISGFLLAALLLGLVGLFVWLFQGRAASSALLLISLAVPLLIFWRSGGAAIVGLDRRYLAFLVPTAMIIIAAGVEAAISLVQFAHHWARRRAWTGTRFRASLVAAILVGILVAQALPALAASYQVPKEDYRAAAEHIVATSPANTVVLAVGAYSDWAVICFQYYFRELNSSVTVVDGLNVTSDIAAKLDAGSGPVWGVIIFPSATQLAWLNAASDVKTDFVDATGLIHVVRAASRDLSPTKQAHSILNWEAAVEPKLSATVKLLDLLSGQAEAGPNLVRDYGTTSQSANGWYLQSGATISGAALDLTPSPAGTQVNATYSTHLTSGSDYVVAFDCRNPGFTGSQTVDAIPLDQAGHGLPTFPGATAYPCPHSDLWSRSFFAMQPPPGTTGIAVILRATGAGTAEFRAVQLSIMTDNP